MIKKMLGIKSPSAEVQKNLDIIMPPFWAGFEHGLKHPNCRSVMTLHYRLPTAKELTLEVMQLEMRRHYTPRRQFIKRFKIQVEIDRTIITARSLGYFDTDKN